MYISNIFSKFLYDSKGCQQLAFLKKIQITSCKNVWEVME